MKYLAVMFISPLYFAVRGMWGGFVINLGLYFFALVTLIFGIGIFFWAIGVAHAGWYLRVEMMHEHAEIMAKKFAEEMRKPQ